MFWKKEIKCIKPKGWCFLSSSISGKRIIKKNFETRKKSTKNYVDLILLLKFFSVQFRGWEIQTNLGSVVYRRTLFLNFWWLLFSGLQTYEKETPIQCFPVNIAKLLRTTILKNIWELLLMNIVLPINKGMKRCKAVLSTILRSCSDILITMLFCQRYNDVVLTS